MNPMRVCYSKPFIHQLYESKDMLALEGVIEAVGRDRQLPEQFWLSRRLHAWCGWSSNGIWQYYENIRREDFESLASALDRFGLHEVATRYRMGMEVFQQENGCHELDDWIDSHRSELELLAFQLIADHRHCLCDEQ